jgi:hypothetical protein
MSEFSRISAADERALAERLKAEGHRECAEFSESLYARVVLAVRQRQAQPACRPAARRASRWAIAAATAACAAGVAWLLVWHAAPPQVPQPGPAEISARQAAPAVDLGDVAESIDRTAQDLGALVETAVATHQWGGVDHDAKLAVDMVLGPWQLEAPEGRER